MKANKFLKLNLEEWSNLENEIYEAKSFYFKQFYEAVEARFQRMRKEKVFANLWSLTLYGNGIGATYCPRFYWSLKGFENLFRIEFELGKGLSIKLSHLSKYRLKDETLKELSKIFNSENGWFYDEDSFFRNPSLFNQTFEGGEIPEIKEIWRLGNETEKYADILFESVSEYFESELVIKLFLEIKEL